MNQLVLIRHSKAEPGHSIADFDRELTPSGRKMATSLGKQLAKNGQVVDAWIISTATRARQTANCLITAMGANEATLLKDGRIKYCESLYFADHLAIIDKVKKAKFKTDTPIKTIAVVAHEPSISAAAAFLSNSKSNESALRFVKLGMSTAMAAILETDKSFSDLESSCAKLHPLIRGEK